MDWSTIDWAAVIKALLALAAAIFGTKFVAEKAGVRVPLLTKPTDSERRMALLGKLDSINEQLGISTNERKAELSRKLNPPTTAPTAETK